MKIKFHKYQGTGNDFVILDNRNNEYNDLDTEQIKKICNRHFGVGGDGLMMLKNNAGYDFEMLYYNADGKPGSMCGNGGRCMVKFVYNLGVHQYTYRFLASDGIHEAEIENHWIRLKMNDVNEVKEHSSFAVLNTGSPHFVKFATDVDNIDVVEGLLVNPEVQKLLPREIDKKGKPETDENYRKRLLNGLRNRLKFHKTHADKKDPDTS